MKHRWTALGAASMTSEQAAEWVRLGESQPVGVGVSQTGLEIWYASVMCAVCLKAYGETGSECLGPPDDGTRHVWQSFFNVGLTEEQASSWAAGEEGLDLGMPQALNVLCVLCGEVAESASPECSERTLWTKETSADVRPEDFEEGS